MANRWKSQGTEGAAAFMTFFVPIMLGISLLLGLLWGDWSLFGLILIGVAFLIAFAFLAGAIVKLLTPDKRD